MLDGYLTNYHQKQVQDSEDLVQTEPIGGRWSYIHKILDRDMFHN